MELGFELRDLYQIWNGWHGSYLASAPYGKRAFDLPIVSQARPHPGDSGIDTRSSQLSSNLVLYVSYAEPVSQSLNHAQELVTETFSIIESLLKHPIDGVGMYQVIHEVNDVKFSDPCPLDLTSCATTNGLASICKFGPSMENQRAEGPFQLFPLSFPCPASAWCCDSN